jgi:hypothetical protein
MDDPMLVATLNFCSECERWSADSAWSFAWLKERNRRAKSPEYQDDDYGADWGLNDRMVCPRCTYVHSDDECSYVDEIVVPVEEPSHPEDVLA